MGFAVLHEKKDTWPFARNTGLRLLAKNSRAFDNYDGFVGWKWSINYPELVKSLPLQFHLVRHPVRAIESATTHKDGVFDHVEAALGKPAFLSGNEPPDIQRIGRAVNYWLAYNKAFAPGKILLRVEDFAPGKPSLTAFCKATGTNETAARLIRRQRTDVNARPEWERRVPVTWGILRSAFPEPAQEIADLMRTYGYDEEPRA